jgi:hypothetical protein
MAGLRGGDLASGPANRLSENLTRGGRCRPARSPSLRAQRRHCDRQVRADASARAVVPTRSADSPDWAIATGRHAPRDRWLGADDLIPQQAVEDVSEDPPDACSRPPNQLTPAETPTSAMPGRAAAQRSPGGEAAPAAQNQHARPRCWIGDKAEAVSLEWVAAG